MNAQVGKELGKGEGFVLELQTVDCRRDWEGEVECCSPEARWNPECKAMFRQLRILRRCLICKKSLRQTSDLLVYSLIFPGKRILEESVGTGTSQSQPNKFSNPEVSLTGFRLTHFLLMGTYISPSISLSRALFR